MFALFDGRKAIEIGGIAVEPSEIENVGSGHVVVQRPVVATVGPKIVESLRQANLFGDLTHGVAVIDETKGLVIDVAVHVALLLEEVIYVLNAPCGPVVLSVHHLGFVAPHAEGLVEVLGPREGLADLRAA
jgi:hypothetical protein